MEIPIPLSTIAFVPVEDSWEAEKMRLKTLKMLSLMKGSPGLIAENEAESTNFITIISEDAEDDDYFFFDIDVDTDCEIVSYSSDFYHKSDSNKSLSSNDSQSMKFKNEAHSQSNRSTLFSDEDDQVAEEMFFMEL